MMLAELGLHAILNLDLLQKVLTFVQDHSDYINGHFTDLIHMQYFLKRNKKKNTLANQRSAQPTWIYNSLKGN